MDLAEVNKSIDKIDTGLKAYVQLSDLRIQATQAKADQIAYHLIENVDIRTAFITTTLFRASNILLLRVSYGTLRLTIHSSPEIITLLLAMITIWRIITFAILVTKIMTIIATIWRIHQILVALWPEYRDAYNKLLTKVSEVSAHIGWGVDGIGHLINAVGGGINVLGGVMGKDWNLMRFEMMEKSNELVVQMSRMLTALKDDPGRWINQMFENRTLLVADDTAKWWKGVSEWIGNAADMAQAALQGTQGVIGELLAIQENMPETIRRNIPQEIWSGLNRSTVYIDVVILPTLSKINRNLELVDNMMDSLSARSSELANKLANPGDILIGIDDLSPWVKKHQERLVDDVTSREFEYWTNQERKGMEGNFNEFDKINVLMHAPTPEPGFLTMEIPKGSTIGEITAEPHETWFPGGYNDPR